MSSGRFSHLLSPGVAPQIDSGEKLAAAWAMRNEGIALHREQLRKRHPAWSTAQLDEAITRWLREEPPLPAGLRRRSWSEYSSR